MKRSSNWTTSRTRTLWLLLAVTGVFAVIAAGAAMARQGAGQAQHRTAADMESSALNQLGEDRVDSIELRDSTASVSGTAAEGGADAIRTLWFESVAGAAFAQDEGATLMTRKVVDEDGDVLQTRTDRINLEALEAFPQTPTRSAQEIADAVQARARGLDATLTQTNYVGLLGGTAELVVEPNNPAEFLEETGSNVATLLGDLSQDNGPYLVTIVDSAGAPLVILGYTPGISRGLGQGVGWEAPGVDSGAIHGRIEKSSDSLGAP